MIDANVLRAVGEVLETHGVTPKSGEGIGDAVARALGLSEGEVHRWVEALSEGCLVEEANRRGGNCQPPGRRPSSGERLPVRSVKLWEESSASEDMVGTNRTVGRIPQWRITVKRG
jgi:hypothetical protein